MPRLNILPDNPEHPQEGDVVGPGRFPSWLHRKLPAGGQIFHTGQEVRGERLHTVCEEAKCPNLLECWSKGTATFLVLGKACTRQCGFCSITSSPTPPPADPHEPERIGKSVKELGLKHVVITMVARDDMPDGGALHLKKVVQEIRKQTPQTTVELLTSDFQGSKESLDILLEEPPEIFNHNVETVRRLTPRVRHKATYERSLQVLAYVKEKCPKTLIKSGLMLGLGEEEEEVKATLQDLLQVGVQIVTAGQYLQPTGKHLLVKTFIPPEMFDQLADFGRQIGIPYVFSGPFIRSSYNAGVVFDQAKLAISSH